MTSEPIPAGGGGCPLCGVAVGADARRCPACGWSLAGVDGRPGPFSARTLWWIVLPSALPRLFTGFKLALSYALIGVIAGEFILSGTGLGYAISFAYQSFDNRAMYGVMLFVLLVAITANGILYVWEGRLARRRSRG